MTITHERGGYKWSHNDSLLTQLECDACWRNIEKRLLPRLMPEFEKYLQRRGTTLRVWTPGQGADDPTW